MMLWGRLKIVVVIWFGILILEVYFFSRITDCELREKLDIAKIIYMMLIR